MCGHTLKFDSGPAIGACIPRPGGPAFNPRRRYTHPEVKPRFFPRISHPCSQDWSSMTGDDKRRFCDLCQLHVHNLSAMSAAEQQALLTRQSKRQCIAYLAIDHAIRVRTGTWLFFQRLLRASRAGLALIAIVLPFGSSSCVTPRQPPPSSPDTHSCKQAHELPDGKLVLGGITYEPPLWRRILFFWER